MVSYVLPIFSHVFPIFSNVFRIFSYVLPIFSYVFPISYVFPHVFLIKSSIFFDELSTWEAFQCRWLPAVRVPGGPFGSSHGKALRCYVFHVYIHIYILNHCFRRSSDLKKIQSFCFSLMVCIYIRCMYRWVYFVFHLRELHGHSSWWLACWMEHQAPGSTWPTIMHGCSYE